MAKKSDSNEVLWPNFIERAFIQFVNDLNKAIKTVHQEDSVEQGRKFPFDRFSIPEEARIKLDRCIIFIFARYQRISNIYYLLYELGMEMWQPLRELSE